MRKQKIILPLLIFTIISEKSTAEEIKVFNTDILLKGGITANYTYQTNTKKNVDEFSLYNLYIRLTSPEENQSLLSFDIGIGHIITPSILDIIEQNQLSNINTDVMNASLIINTPIKIEIGNLEPLEGYEANQTFYNPNIISSAVASIEPFNAYGIRLSYSKEDNNLYLGYYPERYDKEEYCYEGYCAKEAFNIVYEKDNEDIYFFISYYDLKDFFNFINIIFTKEINNTEISLDFDFAFWDSSFKNFAKRNYQQNIDDEAIGICLYVIQKFNKFRLPIRAEYINQGKSQIYIQNSQVKDIYALTITPTYDFTENSFARMEIGYAYAKDSFEINTSNNDESIELSIEFAFLF